MSPSESSVLDAIEGRWGAQNLDQIGLKLGGESGEVQEVITKMREGRKTQDDLEQEIGDVLMVLASIVAKTGAPALEELYRRRFGQKVAEWESV